MACHKTLNAQTLKRQAFNFKNKRQKSQRFASQREKLVTTLREPSFQNKKRKVSENLQK